MTHLLANISPNLLHHAYSYLKCGRRHNPSLSQLSNNTKNTNRLALTILNNKLPKVHVEEVRIPQLASLPALVLRTPQPVIEGRKCLSLIYQVFGLICHGFCIAFDLVDRAWLVFVGDKQ
jgi:hypothetical protein